MARGKLPVLPMPVMTTVKRKNWGGGRQIRATKTPTRQPMMALSITFTGMNHQSRMLDRVTDCPSSVKMRQGRNSANTSLINSLEASGVMMLILRCARIHPNPHMVNTFSTGTTESSTMYQKSSPPPPPPAIAVKSMLLAACIQDCISSTLFFFLFYFPSRAKQTVLQAKEP